ncbi:hypothetical protein RclHR1_05500009 [Rhizophagus clarus]|uniref:Uncharacterized protein n=1 Tax=Rhizophagus clarus TaxID=94130 RepID=A0A2Z6RNP5_9GLOM|nr:hypothetical protein RclHR1_05500009 [Rhizophagus clarus]
MEFLEKYIEVAGYFPDWKNRKQFQDNDVKRPIKGPEDAEECFSVVLLGLKNTIKRKPHFLQEELKEEYYRWINAVGIDVNNCPERLKHILFGFNEILEGRSEKFDRDLENSEQTLDPNSSEYAEEFNKTFAAVQAPLRNERKVAESLADKKHNEIHIESKFSGNAEKGKNAIGRVASSTRNHHNFHFFPQNKTSFR